jgi:tetratricopeptide (TPR) repeat protein
MKTLLSFKTMQVFLLTLSFLFSGSVLSETGGDKSKSSKYKTRKAAAMSQKVYKKLNLIQELIEKKDYVAANNKLESMRGASRRLSAYEKAQSWNLSAYIFYLQENYPDAIKTYQKVLDQGELPEALMQSTIKTMGQLYFATEQYDLALKTVKLLLEKVESPTANMYMLLGQAYFQLKEYKNALKPVKQAVALYKNKKRKPKESWLQLLRVIYHYEDDYNNMRLVLEELVDLYPKDSHLRALAGVYSELGDTHKQLTMMEALYERDYKQSSAQILNLANLYLVQGMPYKAAKVLHQELNVKERVKASEQNYRLLSQSWYQAREDQKSIAPLYKAAKLSESGELYIRIAQAYQNLDQWKKAATAVRTGIKKGGLKRSDTAQLMLGMVLFNQHKLELSQQYFELARKDKRSEKVATQWLAYVRNELHRKTVLDAAMSQSSQ